MTADPNQLLGRNLPLYMEKDGIRVDFKRKEKTREVFHVVFMICDSNGRLHVSAADHGRVKSERVLQKLLMAQFQQVTESLGGPEF